MVVILMFLFFRMTHLFKDTVRDFITRLKTVKRPITKRNKSECYIASLTLYPSIGPGIGPNVSMRSFHWQKSCNSLLGTVLGEY